MQGAVDHFKEEITKDTQEKEAIVAAKSPSKLSRHGPRDRVMSPDPSQLKQEDSVKSNTDSPIGSKFEINQDLLKILNPTVIHALSAREPQHAVVLDPMKKAIDMCRKLSTASEEDETTRSIYRNLGLTLDWLQRRVETSGDGYYSAASSAAVRVFAALLPARGKTFVLYPPSPEEQTKHVRELMRNLKEKSYQSNVVYMEGLLYTSPIVAPQEVISNPKMIEALTKRWRDATKAFNDNSKRPEDAAAIKLNDDALDAFMRVGAKMGVVVWPNPMKS